MWGEIAAVYRKELRTYFVGPIAYFVIALFAGYLGWRFFFHEQSIFFILDKASLERGFFDALGIPVVLLVSIVGMRLWSPEFSSGTIETLLTLPVRVSSLVIGKFLGAWTLVTVCFLATAALPITVASLGEMDWGPVLGGYGGALLMCGALLALASFLSAVTRHQIIAFVLTAVSGGVFILLYELADKVRGDLGRFMEQLSVMSHYQSMGYGVVDLRDVAYFLSFMAFFLYVNVQTIENRRYR
jgi:ABC-2 type transport system permease protein